MKPLRRAFPACSSQLHSVEYLLDYRDPTAGAAKLVRQSSEQRENMGRVRRSERDSGELED